MEWKYVKPLKSESRIKDFEKEMNITFPEDFVNCVKLYNGGRPSKRVFDTDKETEKELKSFLSFNPEDAESIWKVNSSDGGTVFVAFATDNFGNKICFRKDNLQIVFFDHETNNTEFISSDFRTFMASLYE